MKGHIGETTQHQLLPKALAMLAPQPLLLPGARLEDYLILRQAVYAELAPRNAIEWLLTIDIAELSWEIQRYRILRHKLMEKSRQSAVAAALSQIDLIGIPFEWQEDAKRQTELNALAWRSNVDAASDIERRLALYGVD